MQKFLNTETNEQWHFDDDVIVQDNQFFDARGNRLNVPETLIPLPVDWTPPSLNPQYKTQFSVLDFRDKFTIEEQLSIRQAQLTDMEVGLVYDAFISAQFIDVTDVRVEQGLDLYISKGLLEAARKEELLQPELVSLTGEIIWPDQT